MGWGMRWDSWKISRKGGEWGGELVGKGVRNGAGGVGN